MSKNPSDAKPKSPVSKDARSPETSEIRELLNEKEKAGVIKDIAMKCAGDMINKKEKELALKDKRIAELEAELTDKNLPPLEWAKIHAKDREQARSQGRNEAIAEIEKWRERSYKERISEGTNEQTLTEKLASMKKAKA